ncbi:MAG: hypothetical protein M9928_23670 [Anaerolineae bacterium]|nr:hypothetical protein [Anaerolineae bacterium]MCO5194324.1 hypothetical protein [Anaerolineae bacterium]MCO5208009.1 hypothetical protein [Anaerolineae bacterium]
MSNNNIYRVGLIAAILATVSWFVYVFAQMSTPAPSGIENPQQFFQTVQEARTVFLFYGWSGVWGILLGIPYLFAFYMAIVERAPMVQLALLFVLIGSSLAIFGFFKPLTLVYEYLPMATTTDPELLPFLKTAADAAGEVMELPWNLGSLLLFGLGSGLFAFYAWRASIGPKWANACGLIGGLAGIVWLQAYVPFLVPMATILIATNILAISIWAIGLSVSLVRVSADYREEAMIKRPLPPSV